MTPRFKIVICEDAEAGKTVVVTEPTDLRPSRDLWICEDPERPLEPEERRQLELFLLRRSAQRRAA